MVRRFLLENRLCRTCGRTSQPEAAHTLPLFDSPLLTLVSSAFWLLFCMVCHFVLYRSFARSRLTLTFRSRRFRCRSGPAAIFEIPRRLFSTCHIACFLRRASRHCFREGRSSESDNAVSRICHLGTSRTSVHFIFRHFLTHSPALHALHTLNRSQVACFLRSNPPTNASGWMKRFPKQSIPSMDGSVSRDLIVHSPSHQGIGLSNARSM